MPWHEFWFYLDWIGDDKADQANQPFDPHEPSSGLFDADTFGELGANVREV